jgi:hypothetical protein
VLVHALFALQEPHSRARKPSPLLLHPSPEISGKDGREGGTWYLYSAVRLSIFGFLLFFVVGVFFGHREGGREGREVRNTVPQ